jgi:hypothetical protein
MNELNALFGQIIVTLATLMIMGIAVGLMFKGPAGASKVFAWEMKYLQKFVRWLGKITCNAIGNLFLNMGKACAGKKKPKPKSSP